MPAQTRPAPPPAQAYDLLAQGFGPGYNGPLRARRLVTARPSRPDSRRVHRRQPHTPGVARVTRSVHLPARDGRRRPSRRRGLIPSGSPQAASTTHLLAALRDRSPEATARQRHSRPRSAARPRSSRTSATVLSRKLPLFIGDGRPALVPPADGGVPQSRDPFTAATMNLLSTGASFGVVDRDVPVRLVRSPARESPRPARSRRSSRSSCSRSCSACRWTTRSSWSPDLRGVAPHARQQLAVTRGLAATGRTITAAAAIMILVFGSFMLGGQLIIAMFGLGLASAVLLDALIVRSIIVPSAMLVLGTANWALPSALDRVLPHLNVEGDVNHDHIPIPTITPGTSSPPPARPDPTRRDRRPAHREPEAGRPSRLFDPVQARCEGAWPGRRLGCTRAGQAQRHRRRSDRELRSCHPILLPERLRRDLPTVAARALDAVADDDLPLAA